jgi:hypothetical protein
MGPPNIPAVWAPPYNQILNYIVALNNNHEAWYCWTPGTGQPGSYYVPSWDFGNVPLGGASSVLQQFGTLPGAPILVTDPRHALITASLAGGFDIYANRTTALKLDSWLDGITIDNGAPYGLADITRDGNVSVFEIPEPTALAGLLLGLALVYRRRMR